MLEPGDPTPEPRERSADLGFGTPRDLGFMLWDIDHGAEGKPSMFFRAVLRDGVLKVPQPDSQEIRR